MLCGILERSARRGTSRWLFASAILFLWGVGLWTGCQRASDPNLFQGYLEGEYVYVASPLPGALTKLHVQRGIKVKTGDALFELENGAETAARQEAAERLAQARARLENLQKGKRPSELDAIEARLQQANASLQLAQSELKRVERLYHDKVVSIDEFDRAHASRDLFQAQVAEFTAELATGRLGAREDEIKAAAAEADAATAALSRTDWNLSQKRQASPADAAVHDTLYRAGEWVAAGSPVVSLLPPANIKVRFFVPQERLAAVQPGVPVSVSVNGAPKTYAAKVSYISTQAEFTPPVIYSQQTRAKLVFMIEAVFDSTDAKDLHPGQPVDVRLNP
ncbi:MAG: HlyD family efflux transporter periplasmic adaptor subunit [Chloroflexi bacterium]|nr:HlyD family efflux transporter periplasmic adaptor subunit [Chloroflexota bacterium]